MTSLHFSSLFICLYFPAGMGNSSGFVIYRVNRGFLLSDHKCNQKRQESK